MAKPKIRFKGYQDDWEQRKLGEVCSRVQGNDGRMDLPILTISAANGWMKQEDRFSGNIAGREQKNYTLLQKGELSYNHGNSKLAKYGTVFSLQSYEEALVPRVYHSFKVEMGNADFLEYYFATKLPDKELGRLISSGARMDGLLNIGYDEFMGIQMMFPSTKEQDRIADYFRNLDHLITLHQRKCDEAKKLKKFMLQKMFPQNGSLVPEIRFDGFTDDWEQRKLNEITDVRDGTHDSPKYVHEGHPFITSKNVSNGFINYDDVQYVTDEDYEEINKRSKVDVHDILMGMIGTIGNLALIRKEPDFAIKNVALIKYTGDIDYQYLYQTLQADCVTSQLSTEMDGGTQKFVSLKKIRELDIPFPEKFEQRKIGDYFSTVDHLITLHQQKCDDLKNLKKYMLQNMFV